jgi:hypothetical protein
MSEAERISTNETGSDDRSLRNRAIEAYDSALDGASGAGRRAGDAIQETPLIALGAGAVIGAIFAAMLPTSLRERRLLRPYGKKVTDAGREAADAARRAGSDKLRELGLTPDVIADKAGEAARATAGAAVGSIRDAQSRA